MEVFFFHEVTANCGGNLNMASGQVKSPNHPNNYGNRQECVWTITVPAGSQVELKFSAFNVSVISYNQRNKSAVILYRLSTILDVIMITLKSETVANLIHQ